MIDETSSTSRRPTRAEQRAATRLALVEAAADCLVEEGYGALTTRRVAERAGVAQSTLMHHFPAREELIVDAITRLATELADESLDAIDLAALRTPSHREAVLDQAWRTFTSPRALAALQVWVAAWTEPELAVTLRDLEERLSAIITLTATTLFPAESGDPRFPALIDTGVTLIRGLVMGVPISGQEKLDERFAAMKPILLQAASDLLDEPR
ncbi:MAG: TetR/AcrR family transcriptional regulator [Solirubrobacteraceae bacterium]|nr:TetR/AcrR family transcriptional regulator [Solirubrobacteraceae bacterium]